MSTAIDINDVIHAEYDNEMTRDQIIVLLVTEHALTLNAATKAYAALAKELGWTVALVSHKDEALSYIHERFDTLTATDVKSLVIDIAAEFSVADSTARDYIKAWCEAAGQAYPIDNPREAIFAWFKDAGDTADKKEFMAFADGLGRSQSNANEYWKGYELHLHLIA